MLQSPSIFVVCVIVHVYRYVYILCIHSSVTDHKRYIASHPINHHRIPIVNSVAQSVVLADTNAVSLAAGGFHSMVLDRDGDTVLTTGYNNYGQLGDGSNTDKNSFVEVIGTFDMSL